MHNIINKINTGDILGLYHVIFIVASTLPCVHGGVRERDYHYSIPRDYSGLSSNGHHSVDGLRLLTATRD